MSNQPVTAFEDLARIRSMEEYRTSKTKGMKLEIDGTLISCLFHRGGENAIVFIHGFGSSKKVFVEAFETEKLQPFTMLSTDLIGFGESDKPSSFFYRMREQRQFSTK